MRQTELSLNKARSSDRGRVSIQRGCTWRGSSIGPISWRRLIVSCRSSRSWKCLRLGVRRSGGRARRIWRAAWNSRCMMRRDQASPSDTGHEVEAQVTALACSSPPRGAQALDRSSADRGGAAPGADERDQPRNHPADAKKNLLKPWRKLMWCIGELTGEYRRRMYDLLDLYARPMIQREPVICLDEKCKQLLRETRAPLAMQSPGRRPSRTTSTSGPAPAICSSPSNPAVSVASSRSPRGAPRPTLSPSSAAAAQRLYLGSQGSSGPG